MYRKEWYELTEVLQFKDMEGKKIVKVEFEGHWRDKKQPSNIKLHMDDGVVYTLGAYTDAGCPECDPDGGGDLTMVTIDRTELKTNLLKETE